jgi:hypothetical protein
MSVEGSAEDASVGAPWWVEGAEARRAEFGLRAVAKQERICSILELPKNCLANVRSVPSILWCFMTL